MKSLAVLVLFATTVFGQNPYEYVDDALLQRVGQIVYEYDQQVAASRAGGSSSSSSNFNSYSNQQNSRVSMEPHQSQRVARFQNVGNSFARSAGSQNRFNSGPAMQQQQSYRSQRQYNASPVQQVQQRVAQPQPSYQHSSRSQRQLMNPAPYMYQAPSVPAQRSYQEPQVAPRQPDTGLSGYILSQPEPVPRVAEFHFTDEQDNVKANSGGFRNNRFNSMANNNDGFRLA